MTSTLRAVGPSNQTIPIQKIAVIDETSNFLVEATDLDSYGTLPDGTRASSRDFDLRIIRPGQARAFALLLFAVSWMLTHISIGHAVLAWYKEDMKSSMVKNLVFAFGILLAHAPLRSSMPDAPGYDGEFFFFALMIEGSSTD